MRDARREGKGKGGNRGDGKGTEQDSAGAGNSVLMDAAWGTREGRGAECERRDGVQPTLAGASRATWEGKIREQSRGAREQAAQGDGMGSTFDGVLMRDMSRGMEGTEEKKRIRH